MRTVFFHEDDYCQVEILPLIAKEDCLHEMEKGDSFANAHRDGNYYTAVYVRSENPHSMMELSLHDEDLDKALSFLPVYDSVESGYSSYCVVLKSARSRGEGPRRNVIWSENEVGVVDAIWLDLCIWSESKELWLCILKALGQMAPVMLADWNCSQCVDLTSQQEIEQYVEEQQERRNLFYAKIEEEREAGKSTSAPYGGKDFTPYINAKASKCLVYGLLCTLFGIAQTFSDPIYMNTSRDNKLFSAFLLYGIPLFAGVSGVLGIICFLISHSSKKKIRRIVGLVFSIIGIILVLFLS